MGAERHRKRSESARSLVRKEGNSGYLGFVSPYRVFLVDRIHEKINRLAPGGPFESTMGCLPAASSRRP